MMSVEEIKHSIATLSPKEQGEVSAFLFHLRHASDPDYQECGAPAHKPVSDAAGN
jgi:hypothetical protein